MTRNEKILSALLLVACAVIWWALDHRDPSLVGELTVAKEAPQVKPVPKEEITPPKPIKVYRPEAKQRLDLPPEQVNNKAIVVVAASRIPPDLHPQTVITTLDQNTGEFTTLQRREPYPWLAAEQSGELRLDYGIKNGLRKVARLAMTENLVQISALHLGASASIDTDGQFFAGVGVGYRW